MVRQSRKVGPIPLDDAVRSVVVFEKLMVPACERLLVCGSVRREVATVNDIDVLMIPSTGELDTKVELAQLGWDITEHKGFGSIDDYPADIYFTTDEFWGPMVLFLTGSQWENIRLRRRAKSRGYKLSQYGLFDTEGKRIDDNTEESVYDLLETPFLTPQQRSK